MAGLKYDMKTGKLEREGMKFRFGFVETLCWIVFAAFCCVVGFYLHMEFILWVTNK